MLVSFSFPAMLPMVEAGLRQLAGEDVGDTRVKRQTIRPIGPRVKGYLDPIRPRLPLPLLHFWWKSRTKDRRPLGTANCRSITPVELSNVQGYLLVDGVPATKEFWLADGFDSQRDMLIWFVPQHSWRFHGVILKW